MRPLARFLVDHSRPVLAATAVVTLVAVAMLTRMDFNADVTSFLLEGNPTGEQFARLQETYDTTDPITVVATLTDGTTYRDPEGVARLADFVDRIDDVGGTEQVSSVLPETNPVTGEQLTPDMLRLAPAGMVDGMLDANPMADLLVSEDATSAMILVTPSEQPIEVARAVDLVAPPQGTDVVMAGQPVIFGEVLGSLSLFLLLVPPLVVAAMVGIFFLTLGDRRLAILAIIPAALGSLWTFGLIFALGREVDIVTVVVPIFVIVMGSADGLHFMAHFQDEAAAGTTGVDLVASALRHVGIPMILTTVSTAAGFLSLLFTGVQPIEQLGMFAAIGITFAGIISLLALPAVMAHLSIDAHPSQAVLGPRVTDGLARAIRSRVPAAVLGVALVAFAAVFVPQLDVDSDQLFFFKDDDPVRTAFTTIEQEFGAATPLMGEFAWDPSQGRARLDELAEVSDRMEDLPGIRTVFSVPDLAGEVPDDRLEAVLAGDADLPLGDMVSDDGMRFVVFPAEFTTADLQGWQDFAAQEEAVKVLTGMPVVWDEIARLVVRSQVVSLAVAFALVTVLLAVAYRRVRETLVSLLPIALTVAVLLGFLAVSGINLNLLTAVLSSIVIGVGIDYAIHLVAAIDLERSAGPGYAVRGVRAAGRPIVANALGIAVGMTALWLSPLAIHPQISMVMWVSMTVAAATALLVIPAFLPRVAVAVDADPDPVAEPTPAT